MRNRVSQTQPYEWARPTVTGTDEPLREATYDRLLTGAAYSLPMSEHRTVNGIRTQGGILLVLPPDSELQAGDRLRPALAANERYEVTETRAYPMHKEAVLWLCGAEDQIQENDP